MIGNKAANPASRCTVGLDAFPGDYEQHFVQSMYGYCQGSEKVLTLV